MSLRKLPNPPGVERPAAYSWEAPGVALSRWSDAPMAAEADNPDTVSIYGVLGEDMWDDGFTSARMAAALRSIGARAVTVNINSPGGDMFEGLAIYNLLREHPAKVTVKVMGVAASAASLIAMAGDEVLMGAGSVMMIHNAWGMVVGNKHDFADAAGVFETFDASMAAIYAARTGLGEADVMAMLDGPNRASDGTYMTAAEAVEKGFADAIFDGAAPASAQAAVPSEVLARRRMEAALARQGVGRRERADMINALVGQRDATRPAARDAGDLVAGLSRLVSAIRS